MCLGILPIYVTVSLVHAGAHRGQKRVLDPLELELQTFVSPYTFKKNFHMLYFPAGSHITLCPYPLLTG